MQYFCIVFLFALNFGVVFSSAQQCTKFSFHFSKMLEKCSPYDYCLASDQHRFHTKSFSTKTAYQAEKSHDERNDFKVQGCIPSRIWLIVRHGTRLPTSKGINTFSKMEQFRDKIVENAAKMKKPPLCADDWTIFKNWKWNYSITPDQGNYLVEQGFKELSALAYNYKRNLPNLFNGPYHPSKFHFLHTKTERTRSSFKAFVNELFGEFSHGKIDAETSPDDPDVLLKGYANCALWVNQKKKLNHPNSEVRKLENSKLFLKLIADIDARFGFNGTLQLKQIKDIYNMCRYEQAWNTDKVSVWCSLLTPSQVYIFEYLEDLNYFYKSSHGSKLNKNISCFAMQDMLIRLSTDTKPKVTAYFTHSAAIQLFLTSLGALKDEVDLTANDLSTMSIRKWRTSKISPFAANIGVVRYKCPMNDDKVKFFLNENVLHFDWCTAVNGVCDWSDVQEKYAFYANEDCSKVYCRN